ncbi:hypothetical protein BGZ60DRAFT_462571, partial [Tricladium varicosporioides]
MEFHRRTYKFFRRRAWKVFFDSTWQSFGTRFDGILESLSRHRDLVDREAISINIAEERKWRRQSQEDIERREAERIACQLTRSISWLATDRHIDEDVLERYSGRCQPGTCVWILKSALMTLWLGHCKETPVLWLKGIPGSVGKSVICSQVIQFIQTEQQLMVAYYFCTYQSDRFNACREVMRSLCAQILRKNKDLAAHVSENYANCGLEPSMMQLRRLLGELLAAIRSSRIIIDGLDECDEHCQKQILSELLRICNQAGESCKFLISSRDNGFIARKLSKVPTISLNEERKNTEVDIALFVKHRIIDLSEKFGPEVISPIEEILVKKAEGTFLRVQLVITMLEDQYSVQELEDAAEKLPEGLDAAYGRILQRIATKLSIQSRDKATRILEWIACSCRPLKLYELQDGVAIHVGNTVIRERTKLSQDLTIIIRYILDHSSGPFLDFTQAHHNIAFSCISYLSESFILINPSVSEDEVKTRVVKGYHGLHHYANEFWAEHLLRYSELNGGLDTSTSNSLIQQAQKLAEVEEASQKSRHKSILRVSETFAAEINSTLRLSYLNNVTTVKVLVGNVLAFRASLARNTPQALNGKFENDPTLFSEISQRYQSILEYILSCPNSELPTGIQTLELAKFKKSHGLSSFLCRIRNCPRAILGFDSTAQREKHVVTHKPLKCLYPTCAFYVSGFATHHALQAHNKIYHT